MDEVVVSLPLTEVERRVLAMLGAMRPEDDDGLALALLAARVRALRDGCGLGLGWSADIMRGLDVADDVLCLLLAPHPARGRDALIARTRLFSRHRGQARGRVGLFTRSALEADRRHLGLSREELA